MIRAKIDRKNWLGDYTYSVRDFNDQKHLDNYLNKCFINESTSKIIGVTIINK